MYVSAFIGANENFEKAAKSKSAINDSSNKAQDKSSLRDDVQKMESVRYWYPNMSKSEITYVRRIAKLELSTTNNYIDNENKWLYNAKNGNAYFALYSTADVNEPTILYACKGKRAEFEHQFLSKSFEKEVDNNGDIYFRTKIIESILGKYGYVISGANVGNRNVVGGRSNNRNVGVYSKNSRIRPSEALLNCLRNIRETQKRNERNRLEQYYDRDTLSNTSNKAQNLLTNPLVDASNNFQDNKEQKNTADEGGVKKSEREKFAEYNKPITLDDIKVLRSIGRKSINAFTAEEVETAQKWAYKFYKQLGTKSPFFRRWFGDWRAYDIEPANIVSFTYGEQGVINRFTRSVHNEDLNSNIIVDSNVVDDSVSYAKKNGDEKQIRKLLGKVDEIIKNGILFDTQISVHSSGNKKGSTQFMHYLYTPISINGAPFIAKLSIEEYDLMGKNRAYNLQRIELSEVSRAQFSKLIEENRGKYAYTSDALSVSQLFNLVKNYDAEFKPKHVNEALIENGKPKVFYHGTASKFFEFDKTMGGINTNAQSAKKAFFFTSSQKVAGGYAEDARPKEIMALYNKAERLDNRAPFTGEYDAAEQAWRAYEEAELAYTGNGYIMSVYICLNNPFVYDFKGNEYRERTYNDIIMQAKNNGHDGVIFKNTFDASNQKTDEMTDVVAVFSPTSIKSAEDGGNIGTFSEAEADIRYSERDYPIDADVENTVKNAYAKPKGKMHELSVITSEQNKSINRLVNQNRDDSYRGKYEGGKHRFSDTAIRHIISEHGDFLREGLRAQLPMTLADVARHLSAIKDNKKPSSIKATRTKQGNPSILTSYEVNGYTLYAEEITKSLGRNLPNDLIGHTMYKAPTLSTAAFYATSAQTQPRRQSEVLCKYYMPNSTDLSTGIFISDNKGNPALLSFVSKNNSPTAGVLLGGLIALSSDSANLTDKSGQVNHGYVRCKKPFYITRDNRVFSNSETDIAKK